MIENTEEAEIETKAEMHDTEEVEEVIEDNLKPPEKAGTKYSSEDFQKSRNSRTAALFQKHGKLLDEDEDNKEEKKSCCSRGLFCFCRKKNQKKPVDSKQGKKEKKKSEAENKSSCCLFCCSRKKGKKA